MAFSFKTILPTVLNGARKVGNFELNLFNKAGSGLRAGTLAVGNRVLDAGQATENFLDHKYHDLEDALGRGMLPIRQPDNNFRFAQLTQPVKKAGQSVLDFADNVGDKEIDIAKKGGNKVLDFMQNTGNKVLATRDKVNKFLTPKSPDEDPGNWKDVFADNEDPNTRGKMYIGNGGMTATRQKDGKFSYIDVTGFAGPIKNVGAEASKGLIRPLFSKIAQKFTPKAEQFATQWLDRFAPLKSFIKNSNLDAEADPYIAARNFAGRFGKIQNRLSELSDIVKPFKDDLKDIKEYGLLERFEELAKRGITKFPDNLTPEQILKNKVALEQKLGNKLPVVQEALGKLRQFSTNLLTEAKDAGVISEEAFQQILKDNEKYLPLQRLEYLADQADNLPRGAKSFSVATQDIVKGIKGSTKEIVDPIEGMIRNIYKTVNLIERNKVAQKVGDLAKLEEFKDLVIPLNTAEDTLKRRDFGRQLKYLFGEQRKAFSNSQTLNRHLRIVQRKIGSMTTEMEHLIEEAQVRASEFDTKGVINSLIEKARTRERRIYELTVKLGHGEDAKALQEVQKLIGERKGVIDELRNGLRELKPKAVPGDMDKISVFRQGIKEEYAIPKELADSLKGLNEKNIDIVTQLAGKLGGFLRAGATSLNVGFIPANMIRDAQTASLVSKVGFTPWDWLKGFAEAVRRGDDYTKYLESGASFSGFFEQTKSLNKTAKQLVESKGSKIIKTIVNPVKLLQTVGETIELAPRLGVFKRSLRKGLTGAEAAFNARNATVDFAKSGSAMKVANLWVPFLNARLQGTLNVLGAVKQNPKKAAMVIGGIVEIPVIASYFHNTHFHKEIWDDIAQYEKDNNFIIIYGDNRDKDGNPTQVVKMPKGDVGKIFGNPTENFLEYLNHNDPKGLAQVVTEMFSSASPIDFVREGEVSGDALLSSLLPPTIKAGVETSTNKNLFTGRDIVPYSLEKASPEQQYNENTAPLAVALGRFFGISPMKLENAVGSQFGGLGRQVLNPGKFGDQVSGRFSGARGGEDMEKDFKALEGAQTQSADISVEAKRQAKSLFQEVQDLPVTERRAYIMDKLNNGDIDLETLKALGNEVEARAKGFNDFEQSFSSQPNDVKAKFLLQKLKSLPVEQRRAYFEDLAVKGLITEGLLKEMTDEIKMLAQ